MPTFENPVAETSTQRAASSAANRNRTEPPSCNSSRRPPSPGNEPMQNKAHRIAVIEPELSRAVEAGLAEGERIVWLRQPVPWLLWRATLVILIFGVPWTAFAIFWTLGAAGLIPV